MQKQPANRNNPANPLVKVASLDIERVKKSLDEERVMIHASFKRSENIQGFTKNRAGEEVTLNFSLSLTRANVHLRFSTDNGGSAKGFLRISKVAFESPLPSKSRYSITCKNNSSDMLSLDASAGVGASATPVTQHILPAAKLKAGGRAKKTRSSSQEINQHTSHVESNISATHEPDCVYWEIRPQINASSEKYIEGNMFMNKAGNLLSACNVKFNRAQEAPLFSLSVSILVNMSELNVELKDITDRFGEPVSFHAVDGVKVSDRVQTNEAKR